MPSTDAANIKRDTNKVKYDEVKFTRLKDSLFIECKPLLGVMLSADVYLSDHQDAVVKEEEKNCDSNPSERQSQAQKKKTAMSLIHKRALAMARKTRGGERPSLLEVHRS